MMGCLLHLIGDQLLADSSHLAYQQQTNSDESSPDLNPFHHHHANRQTSLTRAYTSL